MTATLGSLAEVTVGLTLRTPEAARPALDGNFHLLRISDIDDFGRVTPDLDIRIRVDDPKAIARHRLLPGDVVLANRGTKAKAGLITQDLPIVAAGQFYIIRIKDTRLQPAYLVWFLNHPETQRTLFEGSGVSIVRSILAPQVRNTQILLPSLATQARIVELFALRAQEQNLVRQIDSLKAQLVDRLLFKAASHTTSHPLAAPHVL